MWLLFRACYLCAKVKNPLHTLFHFFFFFFAGLLRPPTWMPSALAPTLSSPLYSHRKGQSIAMATQCMHLGCHFTKLNAQQYVFIMTILEFKGRCSMINFILVCSKNSSKIKLNPQTTFLFHSVLGKHPLLGKRPCTTFQGVNVATSIHFYILVNVLAKIHLNMLH